MTRSRPITSSRLLNIVSALGGSLPQRYDPNWQLYTDLSAAQIFAFQAFPEWTAKMAAHKVFLQSLGLTSDFSAAAIKGSL